jgi:hypothetical protein
LVTLARLLLRLLIGKPRAQLVVGIIVILFALVFFFAAFTSSPVSGEGIVAGLIFAVVGVLLVIQGVRHWGSTKKPAPYNASYMQPSPISQQQPYAQPMQPAYPQQPYAQPMQPVYPQQAPYAPQQANNPIPYQDQ